METINLTDDEVSELVSVVKTSLSELKTEISHTHHREFKTRLRQQQEMLQGVLLKLAATEQTVRSARGN